MSSNKIVSRRDRYHEIAAEHSSDLRLIYILSATDFRGTNLLARSMPRAGFIMVRRPDTLYWLWRFLHECAHCKLHQKVPAGTPYHWLELEAECYVTKALAAAQIEVSRYALNRSKNYIFGELGADLRAGFEPAPGVFEYIGFSEEEGRKYVGELRRLPQTNRFLRNSTDSWGSRQWAEQKI